MAQNHCLQRSWPDPDFSGLDHGIVTRCRVGLPEGRGRTVRTGRPRGSRPPRASAPAPPSRTADRIAGTPAAKHNEKHIIPGLRIRIHCGSSMLGWIPIQSFNDQKKFTAEKKYYLFFHHKLQFTYPYASIKNVQVTEEAFSSQKRTSSTSKHEISWVFSSFVGHFFPPGSGFYDTIDSGWIRIRNPALYYAIHHLPQ